MKVEKARPNDFKGRFREIVSDPLNLLIERHPSAGTLEDGMVYLHNGLKVPVLGRHAYYGEFSDILIINRGVHEPLEEYIFQEVMRKIGEAPRMLELGAYWGHYSMWLKLLRPNAEVHLVEPEEAHLQAGRENFQLNNIKGTFEKDFVGSGRFCVDTYLSEKQLGKLEVLHADIQSYEVEMLQGCQQSLRRRIIDYLFISTHSQELHVEVIEILKDCGYRVEISADFCNDTTSFDGFVFASSPNLMEIFGGFDYMGRAQIINKQPIEKIDYLRTVSGWVNRQEFE